MCKIVMGAFFFLTVAAMAAALPAGDDLMLDLGDDTAVVESTVREARAAPDHIEELLNPGVTDAFLHKYGDDENAEVDQVGYRKKSQDQGNDGYKHFDSYHKKDGDKYGFETHSEFGKADKASAGGAGKSQKYTEDYDVESDGESNDDDEAESKKTYKVVEDVNEGKKGVRALESYDDDAGYYVDSGADYNTEGEAEAEDGGDAESESDGDSENYEENYEEGDGDSGQYEDGDSESNTEAEAEYDDDGEAYTEDGDDY